MAMRIEIPVRKAIKMRINTGKSKIDQPTEMDPNIFPNKYKVESVKIKFVNS